MHVMCYMTTNDKKLVSGPFRIFMTEGMCIYMHAHICKTKEACRHAPPGNFQKLDALAVLGSTRTGV